MRRIILAIIVLILAACQSPGRDLTMPEAFVRVTDTAVTSGGDFASRIASISLTNTTTQPAMPVILRLTDENSAAEIAGTLSKDVASAAGSALYLGGALVPGGETRRLIFNLKPGVYLAGTFSGDQSFYTTFTVGSSNPSKAGNPAGFVNVELDDVSITVDPQPLASGAYMWEITNSGQQLHELRLLAPAEDATLETVKGAVQHPESSLSPPFTTSEAFGPISPGQRAWIMLNLPKGRYIAACLLPGHPDGGSFIELQVE